MILTDIYVPAVDKTYNFSLNEHVRIESIIAEISEMVEQRERTEYRGERATLNLFYKQGGRILPKSYTLAECAVANGAQLILV